MGRVHIEAEKHLWSSRMICLRKCIGRDNQDNFVDTVTYTGALAYIQDIDSDIYVLMTWILPYKLIFS